MRDASPGRPVVKTLLLTDFVESTQFVSSLGDVKAAEVFAEHDHAARELLAEHGGQEIDKSDGFLFLFDRPIDAVRFSLAYHHLLASLSEDLPQPLKARTGIHLGEVVMRTNPTDDVVRGAKPVEVEGLAKAKTARVMACANGGQTLLTESAYAISNRASVGAEGLEKDVHWVKHGRYRLKGLDEAVALFSVGYDDAANRMAPIGEVIKRKRDIAGPLLAAALIIAATATGLNFWKASQLPATIPSPDVASAELQTEPKTQEPATVQAAPSAVPNPDPAPAPPKQIQLHIESTPLGAQIHYGDDLLGEAPVTIKVPPSVGGHPIQAKLKGHRPGQAFCRVTEADLSAGEARCKVELRPLRRTRPKATKDAPPVEEKPKTRPKIHMID